MRVTEGLPGLSMSAQEGASFRPEAAAKNSSDPKGRSNAKVFVASNAMLCVQNHRHEPVSYTHLLEQVGGKAPIWRGAEVRSSR